MISVSDLFEISPINIDNYKNTNREPEAKIINHLINIKGKDPQAYKAERPYLLNQIKQNKVADNRSLS